MVSIHFGTRLVLCMHLYSVSSEIASGCNNCGCCVDKIYGRHFADGVLQNEICTNGCIDGYGGHRCYQHCPIDCVTCQQHPWQDCKTCANERYLKTDKRCVDCPDRCKQCTSKTECQECKFPYYNDDMITDCSLSCPRNCLCKSIGVCSTCKHGYYNPSNECLDSCPDTCTTCTDEAQCESCQPSYSGDMCCIQDGHCLNCLSSTTCGICTGGYYGKKCNLACPITCQKVKQESLCEKTTGFCKSCDNGAYSNYCNKNCSENCVNKRCYKVTGYCSEGCVDGYEGPTCRDKICPKRTTDIGIVVGTATAVCVALVSVVVVLAIVTVRWKLKIQRQYQEPANSATYVNTSSTDAVDISVINEEIDQSDYERLAERDATNNDEYDQIKSVNETIQKI